MRIPSVVALVALFFLPLFGGVNRWTTSMSSVGAVRELAADPGGANVYARTAAGIYRSTDGGHTWRAVNDGLPEPSKLSAFVAAAGALYAASGSTVFASFDGGATSHCIDGALIEVVGDPRQTSRATNQCGQPFNDKYLIAGIQQGAMVTLRVSANGHGTQEFPVTILGDIHDQMFINFKLEKQ